MMKGEDKDKTKMKMKMNMEMEMNMNMNMKMNMALRVLAALLASFLLGTRVAWSSCIPAEGAIEPCLRTLSKRVPV